MAPASFYVRLQQIAAVEVVLGIKIAKVAWPKREPFVVPGCQDRVSEPSFAGRFQPFIRVITARVKILRHFPVFVRRNSIRPAIEVMSSSRMMRSRSSAVTLREAKARPGIMGQEMFMALTEQMPQ